MKKVIAALGLVGVFVTSQSVDGMEDLTKAARGCLQKLARQAKLKRYPELPPHLKELFKKVMALLPEVETTSSLPWMDVAKLQWGLPILINYVNCVGSLIDPTLATKSAEILTKIIHLEPVLSWAIKTTPITVETAFEVLNGLTGLQRNIFLRLIAILGYKRDEIKNLFGMTLEHYNWKSHTYFREFRVKSINESFYKYIAKCHSTKSPQGNTSAPITNNMLLRINQIMGRSDSPEIQEDSLSKFFKPTYKNKNNELDLDGLCILYTCFRKMSQDAAETLVDHALKPYNRPQSAPSLAFISAIYNAIPMNLYYVAHEFWGPFKAEQTIHPEIIGPAGKIIKLLSEDTNGTGPENARTISRKANNELQRLEWTSMGSHSDRIRKLIMYEKGIKLHFGSK